MIEHVLELSAVVDDPDSVPEADRELVTTVLQVLDNTDELTVVDGYGLKAERAAGLTATIRALLEAHRRERDGRCIACPSPPLDLTWPCWAWRVAHRWLFELDPITGLRRDGDWYAAR